MHDRKFTVYLLNNSLDQDLNQRYTMKPSCKAQELVEQAISAAAENPHDVIFKYLNDKLFDGDLDRKSYFDSVSIVKLTDEYAAGVAELIANTPLIKDGVPFPGDNPEWDALVKSNKSAKHLSILVNAMN